MQSVIEHASGIIFSVKTIRPLCVFPWLSTVWRRRKPWMWTCIATLSYENKLAAEAGQTDLVALLQALDAEGKMDEPVQAVEGYAKKKKGAGVRSYRVYSLYDTWA